MSLQEALYVLRTLVEDCGDPVADVQALKVVTLHLKEAENKA